MRLVLAVRRPLAARFQRRLDVALDDAPVRPRSRQRLEREARLPRQPPRQRRGEDARLSAGDPIMLLSAAWRPRRCPEARRRYAAEAGDEGVTQRRLRILLAHVAVEGCRLGDVMAHLGQQAPPVGDVIAERRRVERDEQRAIADPGAHQLDRLRRVVDAIGRIELYR